MKYPREEIQPGEWQEEVNQWGGVRRFRMVGNVKEYEMTVKIDGHDIPQSEVEDYHRRKKAAQEAQRKAEAEKAKIPARNCPFAEGMQTSCTREKCALFMDGCTLARITAAKATEGLQCPLSKYKAKCRRDCALYNNGCTLTGINNVVIDFSDIKESEDQ